MSRWWPLHALTRTILPLPVVPKRFDAPLWLFILGICSIPYGSCAISQLRCAALAGFWRSPPAYRCRLSRLELAGCGVASAGLPDSFLFARLVVALLGLWFVRRGHHERHLLAFQQRLPLDRSVLADLLREADQQVAAQICVADFAAPELDRHLDPVAFLEKLDRAPDLGVEITLADLDLEPDLLEFDRALVAPGFLLTASLLVLELAIVEQTRDRWRGHRSDLDQIVASLLREPEGIRSGHHARLVSLFIHDPDLRDADHLVDSQLSTQARSLKRLSDVGSRRHATITRRRSVARGNIARRAAAQPCGMIGPASTH